MRNSTEKAVAGKLFNQLPSYAVPLFIRIVSGLETTSTYKSRKVDLRDQGSGPRSPTPVYVLAGRREGYVPFYEGYPGRGGGREASRGVAMVDSNRGCDRR